MLATSFSNNSIHASRSEYCWIRSGEIEQPDAEVMQWERMTLP